MNLEWMHPDTLLFRLIGLTAAILLHDTAQAAAALLLGDRTAKQEGRLTFSPVPHMSASGVFACLFGPFGWSKPVPLRPEKFRKKPKLSGAVVYACGPACNLAFGVLLWWGIFALALPIWGEWLPVWALELLRGVVQWTYILNMMLVILHLLPVYPMDVWKTIRLHMPARWEPAVRLYERAGPAVLIAFVITPFGQDGLNRCFETATGIIMKLYSFV